MQLRYVTMNYWKFENINECSEIEPVKVSDEINKVAHILKLEIDISYFEVTEIHPFQFLQYKLAKVEEFWF